jgi:hypothetical protein
LVDPVGAFAAGNAAAGRARNARSTRRGHASNVVLLIAPRPRALAGYEIVGIVTNDSTIGIADVSIHLRMLAGGDLRLGNRTMTEARHFARRALAAGRTMEVKFPYIARLPEASWDLADDRGPGYVETLYWRDADAKRWKRTAGGAATRCRAKDFPEPD